MPLRPVQALALPEFTSTARQRPWLSARFCRERSTGAAATRFVVNRPAAVVAGASETIKRQVKIASRLLDPRASGRPTKTSRGSEVAFHNFPVFHACSPFCIGMLCNVRATALSSVAGFRFSGGAYIVRHVCALVGSPLPPLSRRIHKGQCMRHPARCCLLNSSAARDPQRLAWAGAAAQARPLLWCARSRRRPPCRDSRLPLPGEQSASMIRSLRDDSRRQVHVAALELANNHRVTIINLRMLKMISGKIFHRALRLPFRQNLGRKLPSLVRVGL